MEIGPNNIFHFTLILLRVSTIVFILPFFGETTLPAILKILFALILTIAFFPLIPSNWGQVQNLDALVIAILIGKEFLLGAGIAYASKLIFEGIVMAANIVGYQMGFGTANLILPGSDMQVNAFTALHRNLALIFFLGLSLHYAFIIAIIDSFKLFPLGFNFITGNFVEALEQLSSGIFTTSLQLAAPMLVALMFTMAALGLIARTVPQMNVFTLSFPLSFFIGLGIYLSMLPLLPGWLKKFYLDQINLTHLLLQRVSHG